VTERMTMAEKRAKRDQQIFDELQQAVNEEITGRKADGRPLFRNWTRPAQELIDYIHELEDRLGIDRSKGRL
jgi:mRNA deadenylase 3'-5' endonuclease subunit Ccr4